MIRADFKDLVQQHNRNLYVCAFRILRNQEEAEDAVQEVFIKLWNMGTRLDEYNSIGALSTTMIRNYCIDQLRKRKQVYSVESEGKEIPDINIDNGTPLELLETRESEAILNTIIDRMPEVYRIAIRMKEIDGLSYEEIADKTGQNINTLRVTLSRARKMIRDEFNKYQYERRRTKEVDRKVLQRGDQ